MCFVIPARWLCKVPRVAVAIFLYPLLTIADGTGIFYSLGLSGFAANFVRQFSFVVPLFIAGPVQRGKVKQALVPSPVSSEILGELDTIVNGWIRWRQAQAREHKSRIEKAYLHATNKMKEVGLEHDGQELEKLFMSWDSGRFVRPPEEGDALFSAFTQLKHYYKQAEMELAITANWDVPTTDGLVAEIDDYVRRVDKATQIY